MLMKITLKINGKGFCEWAEESRAIILPTREVGPGIGTIERDGN